MNSYTFNSGERVGYLYTLMANLFRLNYENKINHTSNYMKNIYDSLIVMFINELKRIPISKFKSLTKQEKKSVDRLIQLLQIIAENNTEASSYIINKFMSELKKYNKELQEKYFSEQILNRNRNNNTQGGGNKKQKQEGGGKRELALYTAIIIASGKYWYDNPTSVPSWAHIEEFFNIFGKLKNMLPETLQNWISTPVEKVPAWAVDDKFTIVFRMPGKEKKIEELASRLETGRKLLFDINSQFRSETAKLVECFKTKSCSTAEDSLLGAVFTPFYDFELENIEGIKQETSMLLQCESIKGVLENTKTKWFSGAEIAKLNTDLTTCMEDYGNYTLANSFLSVIPTPSNPKGIANFLQDFRVSPDKGLALIAGSEAQTELTFLLTAPLPQLAINSGNTSGLKIVPTGNAHENAGKRAKLNSILASKNAKAMELQAAINKKQKNLEPKIKAYNNARAKSLPPPTDPRKYNKMKEELITLTSKIPSLEEEQIQLNSQIKSLTKVPEVSNMIPFKGRSLIAKFEPSQALSYIAFNLTQIESDYNITINTHVLGMLSKLTTIIQTSEREIGTSSDLGDVRLDFIKRGSIENINTNQGFLNYIKTYLPSKIPKDTFISIINRIVQKAQTEKVLRNIEIDREQYVKTQREYIDTVWNDGSNESQTVLNESMRELGKHLGKTDIEILGATNFIWTTSMRFGRTLTTDPVYVKQIGTCYLQNETSSLPYCRQIPLSEANLINFGSSLEPRDRLDNMMFPLLFLMFLLPLAPKYIVKLMKFIWTTLGAGILGGLAEIPQAIADRIRGQTPQERMVKYLLQAGHPNNAAEVARQQPVAGQQPVARQSPAAAQPLVLPAAAQPPGQPLVLPAAGLQPAAAQPLAQLALQNGALGGSRKRRYNKKKQNRRATRRR